MGKEPLAVTQKEAEQFCVEVITNLFTNIPLEITDPVTVGNRERFTTLRKEILALGVEAHVVPPISVVDLQNNHYKMIVVARCKGIQGKGTPSTETTITFWCSVTCLHEGWKFRKMLAFDSLKPSRITPHSSISWEPSGSPITNFSMLTKSE